MLKRLVLIGTAALALSVPAWAMKDPAPGGAKPRDAKPKDAKPLAKLGAAAPDFSLKDFAGKSYKLADYKDKVVVLEWFNKDCPFCKMYCDELKETAATYGKQGVVWFAVDSTHFRTDEENAAHAKEHKVSYPILSDFDGQTGHAYGAKTTPHVFIINKGTLVYEGAFRDLAGRKHFVAAALDDLLAGKPVAKPSTKPFG
ncbi:MAG: redoxin domain-containing protein [Phycisphaerae bacterium]